MSKYRITLEGKTYEMEVELVEDDSNTPIIVKKPYKGFSNINNDPNVNVIDPSAQKKVVKNTGIVYAPMPGTIIRIEKSEGSLVEANDLVMILEAMKMENEIIAPIEGVISSMSCKVGETVAGGDVLFEVKRG